MKSNIKIIYIPTHSDAWYRFRSTGLTVEETMKYNCDQFDGGIGGSEIGTVLGLNKYDTPARLYHQKVGTIELRKDDNERMLWGRVLEEQIARMWTYWDGSQDGYVQNFNNNKIIRTCRNVNGYIWNPKYPWLFVSLDRLINKKGGFNLITGEPLDKEGILEAKNMGYWTSQTWEDGIPISYLCQITEQMIVTELDYVEIPMLIDGGRFNVEKFMLDEDLAHKIINISKDFWYNRVVPAKEARKKMEIAQMEGNLKEVEKYDSIIQQLEPEADGSDAYKEFIEERFVKTRESVRGSIEMFELAKRYKFLGAIKSRIEKDIDLLKNTFLKFMSSKECDTIDFDSLGKVSWTQPKNQKNRRFSNNITEKPSEDIIEREYSKLDYKSF